MSLGLRCWEAATNLPLFLFAAATSTLKIKFLFSRLGSPRVALRSLHRCCSVTVIVAVAVLCVVSERNNRDLKQRWSQCAVLLFSSLFLPWQFPASSLPFPSSWSTGSTFLWHYPQWRQALSWAIISDSMPKRSSLLFLVFMCFSWLPYHLLTQ